MYNSNSTMHAHQTSYLSHNTCTFDIYQHIINQHFGRIHYMISEQISLVIAAVARIAPRRANSLLFKPSEVLLLLSNAETGTDHDALLVGVVGGGTHHTTSVLSSCTQACRSTGMTHGVCYHQLRHPGKWSGQFKSYQEYEAINPDKTKWGPFY